MGKLSILGAKRVEALQVILDKQCQEEINSLHDPYPNSDEEKYKFITHWYLDLGIDIQKIVIKHNDLSNKLNKLVIGRNVLLPRFYRNSISVYDFWDNDMFDFESSEYKKYESDKAAIEHKYNEKKNQLWLCESLEEAKEIVGIN